MIAAVAKNNVIGIQGRLPWHSKQELTHFKNTTIGFPVIMGRKTWESLGTDLSGRINIILSRRSEINRLNDAKFFHSLKESIEFCERESYEKCFIIGGGEIFELAINIADEMIISRMKKEYPGEIFFPEIDPEIWEESLQKDFDEFAVHTYIRKVKLNGKEFEAND